MFRYILPVVLLLHSAHPDCPAYGTVNNGAVTPLAVSYATDDVITITCSTHYLIDNNTLDATSLQAICRDDTTWNQTTGLHCVVCRDGMTDCGDHGFCSAGYCDCDTGYELIGVNECRGITCSLDSVPHASVAPEQDSYASGDVVTVTCEADYHVKETTSDSTAQTTCNAGNWDPATTDIACIICDKDEDCTNGQCTGELCVCDNGYTRETANSCVELVCPENYCKGLGTCSVSGDALQCECIDGVIGDTCNEYETDPCETSPCYNEGNCSRSPAPNVRDYTCLCTGTFTGDECQYSSNFYINSGTIKILQEAEVVKLNVTLPANVDNMLIALVQVDDNKKLVLTKTSASCLGISITMVDEEDVLLDSCSQTASLDTPQNIIELYRKDNRIAVKVNSVVLDYSGPDFNLYKAVVLGACSWDDVSTACLGPSRVYYTPFVGTLHGVTIGTERYTWSQLQGVSTDIVNTTLACQPDTCGDGVCSVSSAGQLACQCNEDGVEGFLCQTYRAISFNGYTSTYHASTVNVSVARVQQVMELGIVSVSEEEGLLAVFNIADTCVVRLTREKGYKYTFNEYTFTHDTEDMKLVFDGQFVIYTSADETQTVKNPCTWDFAAPSTQIVVSLGGDTSDTAQTRQAAMFGGCIRSLTLNSVPLLLTSATSGDLDTTTCTDNFKPPDPCTDLACQNEMPCEIEAADYSGSCTCSPPYVADATCGYQDHCQPDYQADGCNAEHGTCNPNKDTAPWYTCACNDGWEGEKCDEEEDIEPLIDETNHTTTIVVVVIVAVILAVIVVILLVRRRKNNAAANGDTGKTGTYSPQEAERGMELGTTNGKHVETGNSGNSATRNIYDSSDVIKNPNVESKLELEDAQEMPPPPPPPASTTGAPPPPATAPVESVYPIEPLNPVEPLYPLPDTDTDPAHAPAPI